jgi:hypothetical protein
VLRHDDQVYQKATAARVEGRIMNRTLDSIMSRLLGVPVTGPLNLLQEHSIKWQVTMVEDGLQVSLLSTAARRHTIRSQSSAPQCNRCTLKPVHMPQMLYSRNPTGSPPIQPFPSMGRGQRKTPETRSRSCTWERRHADAVFGVRYPWRRATECLSTVLPRCLSESKLSVRY